jgi:radical SAM superfamily enzyme YgiQ (UPF0313 family)
MKSYAEQNGEFRVRNIDLNVMWLNAALKGLEGGSTAFSLEQTQDFSKANEFMRGDVEAFDDDAVYQKHSTAYNHFTTMMLHLYSNPCQEAFDDAGAMPWFVIEYARYIAKQMPRVVGLSVMFTIQLPFAALLARVLKIIDPEILVVFGGGFFNSKNLESFLSRPEVDYVILHEGEDSFLKLLETIRDDGDPAEVPGIAYQKEDASFLVRENLFKLNHDDLPFADYSDFDLKSYFTPEPVFSVISSRGCYWRRCTFCDHFASFAGTYKVQSISRVVLEMEHHLKTYGVRHFSFVDEMISAKRLKKISEEIIARGLDVHWYALSKPTKEFTSEILSVMKESGCKCVYWGVESGSERVIALMDKGNDIDGAQTTLKASTEAGLRNHLFMIVGFPSETREELDETLDFLHENRAYIDKILGNPYVLKKGTPIHDHHHDFGIGKVYHQRSICNSTLLKYETSRGMTPDFAAKAASYLQVQYFDRFSERGKLFGTPRDHIILVYGLTPPPDLERDPDITDPAVIKAALDETGGAYTPEDSAKLVPIWS